MQGAQAATWTPEVVPCKYPVALHKYSQYKRRMLPPSQRESGAQEKTFGKGIMNRWFYILSLSRKFVCFVHIQYPTHYLSCCQWPQQSSETITLSWLRKESSLNSCHSRQHWASARPTSPTSSRKREPTFPFQSSSRQLQPREEAVPSPSG